MWTLIVYFILPNPLGEPQHFEAMTPQGPRYGACAAMVEWVMENPDQLTLPDDPRWRVDTSRPPICVQEQEAIG